MEFAGNIYIKVSNGTEESQHVFENENLRVSRASVLWIQNDKQEESNFYETLKMWHGIDKNTNTQSYLEIKTEPLSQIESFREYFIEKINEENKSITFNWKDNR